jgi:hypothetical protein
MGPLSTIRRLTPVAVVVVAASVGLAATVGRPLAAESATLRILLIGNSLTAANNLPAIVEALGRAKGGQRVEATAVTANNFSLEDHWNQGNARAAIAKGGWSVVVLQQGPSALPESRVLLRDYVKRFAAEARKTGARTALYMVWPSKARTRDFDDVSESYALAARDVEGILLPAGDAWREAWRRDPSLALYADDGFHPSPLGSYVAALAVWRGLSAQSTLGLPGPRDVAADTLRLVQESVDQVATVNASPSKGSAVPR